MPRPILASCRSPAPTLPASSPARRSCIGPKSTCSTCPTRAHRRPSNVLAGRVSMMFADLTSGLPHVRSRALRALAVTRLRRSSLFPELPTLDEAGVTGFDMDSWAGIVAPAHTPPPIVTKLNKELRKIIDDPDVNAKLGNVGFEGFSIAPTEFVGFSMF